MTGKWVDDVVTPWGAVKEEQRKPFSKIPGQQFNYAKVMFYSVVVGVGWWWW